MNCSEVPYSIFDVSISCFVFIILLPLRLMYQGPCFGKEKRYKLTRARDRVRERKRESESERSERESEKGDFHFRINPNSHLVRMLITLSFAM